MPAACPIDGHADGCGRTGPDRHRVRTGGNQPPRMRAYAPATVSQAQNASAILVAHLGPRVGIALAITGSARRRLWPSDQLRAVLSTRARFVLRDEPELMPFPPSGAGLRPPGELTFHPVVHGELIRPAHNGPRPRRFARSTAPPHAPPPTTGVPRGIQSRHGGSRIWPTLATQTVRNPSYRLPRVLTASRASALKGQPLRLVSSYFDRFRSMGSVACGLGR